MNVARAPDQPYYYTFAYACFDASSLPRASIRDFDSLLTHTIFVPPARHRYRAQPFRTLRLLIADEKGNSTLDITVTRNVRAREREARNNFAQPSNLATVVCKSSKLYYNIYYDFLAYTVFNCRTHALV